MRTKLYFVFRAREPPDAAIRSTKVSFFLHQCGALKNVELYRVRNSVRSSYKIEFGQPVSRSISLSVYIDAQYTPRCFSSSSQSADDVSEENFQIAFGIHTESAFHVCSYPSSRDLSLSCILLAEMQSWHVTGLSRLDVEKKGKNRKPRNQ